MLAFREESHEACVEKSWESRCARGSRVMGRPWWAAHKRIRLGRSVYWARECYWVCFLAVIWAGFKQRFGLGL